MIERLSATFGVLAQAVATVRNGGRTRSVPIVAVNTPKRGKNQMNPNKPRLQRRRSGIADAVPSAGSRLRSLQPAPKLPGRSRRLVRSVLRQKICPTAGGATPRLMAFCQRAGKALPAIDQQIDGDARRHAGNPSCEWRPPYLLTFNACRSISLGRRGARSSYIWRMTKRCLPETLRSILST